MGEFVKVALSSDVPSGEGKAFDVNGEKIAVFHVNGNFFALGDTCPHRGGPLSEGTIEGDQVICPWHAAAFDLKSGRVSEGPSATGVKCYNVKLEGNEIKIEIPSCKEV